MYSYKRVRILSKIMCRDLCETVCFQINVPCLFLSYAWVVHLLFLTFLEEFLTGVPYKTTLIKTCKP